jgi:hypothetical protein
MDGASVGERPCVVEDEGSALVERLDWGKFRS